ncbi:thymidine phosphorylase [Candidatus Sumerlaeota bacterium]|nr:thymidine phosphorylase [Candidatus Sumerlaeota bacterium]
MRGADLIRVKRDRGELSEAQIREMIRDYVAGKIPDYQMSAWLMAVYFNGMTDAELRALTGAMIRSGECFDLRSVPGVKADKHSTGGVGDKISLILAPLAAACGLVVPMVSGRGLGHTGGTLDKLEAIPGFRTQLTAAQFRRQLSKIGLAMGGQTARFVPADRKLYALRDVTATVESIPLIAASIMSKKLAEGCDVLVLDVKAGNGAFMNHIEDARRLASTMTGIGRSMGRKVSAIITNMDQPLGFAVGNANEVAESIEVLRGEGPADIRELTFILTARMLILAKRVKNETEARHITEQALTSGAALEKFRKLIEAQGGDPRIIDRPDRLPQAPRKTVIKAVTAGWIKSFQTREIGAAAAILGGGRALMSDTIDPAVGIRVCAKIGDKVEKHQPIFEIAYRRKDRMEAAVRRLNEAYCLAGSRVRPPKLILDDHI